MSNLKLTKEECFSALSTLSIRYIEEKRDEPFHLTPYGISSNIILRLINEHFDNNLAGQVDKLKKDLEITCKLHDDLLENYNNQKKRMKQLEQENEKLKKQVHSYYMAMCTGKGE